MGKYFTEQVETPVEVSIFEGGLKKVSNFAPYMILIGAICCFVFLLIIEHDYMVTVFKHPALAWTFPCIIQFIKFILLIATVSDFANGKGKFGSLGMLGSIALFAFDMWLLGHVAMGLFPANPDILNVCLKVLCGLGLGLEIRIVFMLMGATNSSAVNFKLFQWGKKKFGPE